MGSGAAQEVTAGGDRLAPPGLSQIPRGWQESSLSTSHSSSSTRAHWEGLGWWVLAGVSYDVVSRCDV